LAELLRVTRTGGQVCIYPLVTLGWQTPPYLQELLLELQETAAVRTVPTMLPFTPAKSPVLKLDKIG